MGDSSFTKPLDDLQEFKNEPMNYTAEIRQMMYGFGDSPEPMIETVRIVEEVVLKEMRAVMARACEIAELRGTRTVSAEDFLFLMRKDKVKLQRLVKYLRLKEFKSNMCKTLDVDPIDGVMDESKSNTFKFSCSKFVSMLDNTGDLLQEKVDIVKQKRNLRAEMISRKLDEARYLEYSKARCASFANKNKHKFSDWIGTNGDFTVSKLGYTVLGYLAYETVAQIVDMALIIRQDQNKQQGDPIDRLRLSYPNPVTYKPYQYTTPVMTKPITPAEVSEALRRYWTSQFDITGPFHRWNIQKPHLKFLAL